jgi:hypothetical protein
MTTRRVQILLYTLVLLPSAHSLSAQTSRADSTAFAARRFAQSFFDWYTRIAVDDSLSRAGMTAAEIATQRRPEAFSRQLLTALRADFTAQAKANGELVGLDFDPFLSGQDPCERYRVGKVSYQQNAYLADVYPVCNGKLSDSASVVIELQSTGSSWRFVNFRYPRSHTDLIEELRLLREQRLKK